MKIKEEKVLRKGLAGKRRKLENGNALWKIYNELGFSQREKFKALLATNKINFQAFLRDSKIEVEIANIEHKRYAVYSEFFGEAALPKYEVLLPAAESREQAHEEVKVELAIKLGLVKT